MGAIMTILGMIPGISTLIEKLGLAYFNAKVQRYQTRWGVTQAVAVAAIQAEAASNNAKVGWLNAVASSTFLKCIVGGFAFPLIAYMNKAYVWDNMIHPIFWDGYGFTPPLTGLVADWGGIIIGGIFVTSTGMQITNAVLNRAAKDQ